MTSGEFNRSLKKGAVTLGIWGVFVLFLGIRQLMIGGGLTRYTIILMLAYMWVPTINVLYGLKTKEIYPQMGYFQRLFLTSARHNGGNREVAKYFNQIWRRCLLVFPMINELLDDKRTLELREAATNVTDAPKILDL